MKSHMKTDYVGKAVNFDNDSKLAQAIDKPVVIEGRAVSWPQGQSPRTFDNRKQLRNYSKSDLRRANINKAITNDVDKLLNDYNYRNGGYIDFISQPHISSTDYSNGIKLTNGKHKYYLDVGYSDDAEDIMKGVDVLKKIRELTSKYL